MRIGHGYDVHRLVENRKLIIGGEEIPYELGLLGHSDADVLTHAVMDALLGACALGDIGKHFPDTDEKWSGADSIKMLRHVIELIGEKGYKVENIDSTIICQRPKLAPYIENMRSLINDRNVELARVLYHIVGKVCLVHRDGYLHGAACKLDKGVDDTAVILVPLRSGQHVQSV